VSTLWFKFRLKQSDSGEISIKTESFKRDLKVSKYVSKTQIYIAHRRKTSNALKADDRFLI